MSKNNGNKQPQKANNMSQETSLTPPVVETREPAQLEIIQREGAIAIEKDGVLQPIVDVESAEKAQEEINRELSGRTDLTEAEVIAAGGQINREDPAPSAPAAVAEPKVETPPAPAPVVATAPPVPHEPSALPLGVSALAKISIAELKDYIEAASAKARPHDAKAGALQMGLHQTIIQLINVDADSFQATWKLAMSLIRENLSGCFATENVHRFTPFMALPPAQANSFRMLVNALTALADPSEPARAIAKNQINIELALSNTKIKEESRQRVMAYFNFA